MENRILPVWETPTRRFYVSGRLLARNQPAQSGRAGTMFLAKIVVLLATCFCCAAGVPFEPASDDAVLEKLPRQTFTRATAPMGSGATNVAMISARVEEHIRAYRAEADPRYLGYAEALLRPWWHSIDAPLPVLVLRATIQQSLHHFDRALQDLDLALSRDPQNAQAWLTRATILQVQGRLPEARKACLPLFKIGPRHLAVASLASVASLNGEARQSYDLLRAVLRQSKTAPVEETLWMRTILAEIAVRLGRFGEAESHFQEALAIRGSDVYLLAAYADLLLELGRPKEAAALLNDKGRADALLLRRAIGRRQMNASNAQADIDDLSARFAASRLRGDATHSREEARFELTLMGNAQRALELALSNWRTQREPADARILLEAALAEKAPEAAEPALAWIQATGLEDQYLASLVKKLHE